MSFTLKFMDGSPVDAEYAERVAKLIRDAAEAEVSEQEEATLLANPRQCWSTTYASLPWPDQL